MIVRSGSRTFTVASKAKPMTVPTLTDGGTSIVEVSSKGPLVVTVRR